MKKVLDGLISRLDMAEERISELEDISIEFTKSKQTKLNRMRKKTKRKTEQNIKGLWDNYKCVTNK